MDKLIYFIKDKVQLIAIEKSGDKLIYMKKSGAQEEPTTTTTLQAQLWEPKTEGKHDRPALGRH